MSITQREWLLDTEDWAYEEMEWSDAVGRPSKITWRFRGRLVSITATTSTPMILAVHGFEQPQRQIILVDNPAGSAAWRYLDTFEIWWINFNPAGLGADVRDIAERMVIDFLAQLRRKAT